MGLVGNEWANCFRTHNELTMGLPGKYPLAPSVNHVMIAIRSIGSSLISVIPVDPITGYHL